ncbi:MAG: phosphoribosylaminoimidazolesuccinocarboxamide synthase [Aestuariivita sp.]|nr:phosphoribosylaminoimidazolesuccinocarboxamide synthase [Aestuariivita sp.]MCY4201099.1 phosphoribosylaminoimidazolesuccinocarboxamide synthase [Aestuariivita sp.]MCY4288286.1 phosphoribosylaminoimidazolesuccinocarboxamide synthase [Aestuariivita sp.]MCY4345930.1 phosphoribosylaminoimidazolesuccinocarboxamide synthase [Aestuariivita sp.]
MESRKKIYEGKAKILYSGPTSETAIQYFKDDITAGNGEQHAIIEGKGTLNNHISEFFMVGLSGAGVPNHFKKRINNREQLTVKCKVFPIEVIVRNVASGSICRRLGIEEKATFSQPIVEYYLKNDDLNDPLVNENHIVEFGWASSATLNKINSLALRANSFLLGVTNAADLRLVDFKTEYGVNVGASDSEVMMVDEISPDTCRFWDIHTDEKLDKDVFREGLGSVLAAYQEVASRLAVVS